MDTRDRLVSKHWEPFYYIKPEEELIYNRIASDARGVFKKYDMVTFDAYVVMKIKYLFKYIADQKFTKAIDAAICQDDESFLATHANVVWNDVLRDFKVDISALGFTDDDSADYLFG